MWPSGEELLETRLSPIRKLWAGCCLVTEGSTGWRCCESLKLQKGFRGALEMPAPGGEGSRDSRSLLIPGTNSETKGTSVFGFGLSL